MRSPLRPVELSGHNPSYGASPVFQKKTFTGILWSIYSFFCEAAMQNIYNAPLSEEETKLRYINSCS